MMRFLLFFAVSFFASTSEVEYLKKYHKLQRDNAYFSNIIRINIEEIPYKYDVIKKKINIAQINIKNKPINKYNHTSSNTDSKIKPLNNNETIIISSLTINKKNNHKYNDKQLIEHNNNPLLSNNFVVMVNDHKEEAPSEEIPADGIIPPKLEDDKELLERQDIIETINKAVNYNPKIKAQKSMHESSKENVKQVYSAIFPSIEMTLSKGYKDTDSSSSTTTTNENSNPQDFKLSLEQNLYTGGKFSAEANKAKNNLLIEKENLRITEYEVMLESALAYLEVLEKKKLVELNNLKEEKFKNDFQSINQLVNVGSASQSDLVFAQSMLVQIAAEKIASVNDLNITKANYKKIVGEILPNKKLNEPKINKTNFPGNINIALNKALINNPQIKIAELNEKNAKFDIKSEFADALPNITMDAEYKSSDDTVSKGSSSDTAEITANIKVPLFKGGKNISKIKQAKIIAKKVRYELENKKNEITQSVTKSWTDFQTSETLLKAANINIEARKLILEGIQQEAKLGIKSYIDVLQSREDLIDAEFSKITATKNYIFSALQLKADIGELSLKDLYI